MNRCPKCGLVVSSEAVACPDCGTTLRAGPPPVPATEERAVQPRPVNKNQSGPVIVVAVLLLLAILGVLDQPNASVPSSAVPVSVDYEFDEPTAAQASGNAAAEIISSNLQVAQNASGEDRWCVIFTWRNTGGVPLARVDYHMQVFSQSGTILDELDYTLHAASSNADRVGPGESRTGSPLARYSFWLNAPRVYDALGEGQPSSVRAWVTKISER